MVVGIRRLGYVEFRAARTILKNRVFRRAVQEEIYLEELRHALTEAQTREECWTVLQQACEELSLSGAHLQLGSELFVREAMMASDVACQLRISLAENKWLLLTGSTPVATRTLATLIHHIQAAVHQRLAVLQDAAITMDEAA